MSLLGVLPAPKHITPQDDDDDQPIQATTTALVDPRNNIPPYGKRKGWIPRSQADFGDGGAFPEIHVAQYPFGMGHKDTKSQAGSVIPLSIGADGKVRYDAVINQGRDKDVVVYSSANDLIAKRDARSEYQKPDEEEERKTAERTTAALEQIVNSKISAAQPNKLNCVTNPNESAKYIRYTPAQQGAGHNSGAQNRVIRMVEAQRDPLEPPKFKHKKVPAGPPSPPVPVMHSPPRKLTAKDQADWKIPPCISNWKNNKGYTIPLDKRLAADGRGLQEVQINDNFAKLSEALYIAERQAREELTTRNQETMKINMKMKEAKEEELRNMAARFREERSSMAMPALANESKKEREERIQRENLREDRKRDRTREYAMEKLGAESKKSKVARDRDRDVSEKIALGMAQPTKSQETVFDQRLFNQTEGMDSGLHGADDAYNVYDKPLFAQKNQSLYRPGKLADDDRDFEEDAAGRTKSKPVRDFSGVDSGAAVPARTKPVEFEKEDEPDPFGLDQFMTDAKSAPDRGKKDSYSRDRR